MSHVDPATDIAEYLTSRRAKVTPEQASDATSSRRSPFTRRGPFFESREQPANSARFTFLDPAAQDFYADWERTAKDLVAHLRSEAGRNPYDRDLSNLIGELSTRSPEFRTWWAAHNVRFHQTGTKRLHHPVVGDLELSYEVMELSADTGLTVSVYSAEP